MCLAKKVMRYGDTFLVREMRGFLSKLELLVVKNKLSIHIKLKKKFYLVKLDKN